MERRQAQRGGSRIGFVIALLVVGYGLIVLFTWGPMRIDHYEFEQKVIELLKFKNTFRPIPNEEDLRQLIYEKAREIGIAEFVSMENIRVWRADNRIHAEVKYQRPFKVPLIEKTFDYEVSESWSD